MALSTRPGLTTCPRPAAARPLDGRKPLALVGLDGGRRRSRTPAALARENLATVGASLCGPPVEGPDPRQPELRGMIQMTLGLGFIKSDGLASALSTCRPTRRLPLGRHAAWARALAASSDSGLLVGPPGASTRVAVPEPGPATRVPTNSEPHSRRRDQCSSARTGSSRRAP